MKVSELFYELSVGELSNLSMSNEGSGTIREKDQGKLIVYINGAMRALHARFVLSTREVLIECFDHITNYKFDKKYALSSGSSERYKYIIDTNGSPFQDDVVKIVEVYDSRGNALPLNDPGHSGSLFTPSPDILQVPEPITRNALSVMYQADHVNLQFVGLSSTEVLAQEIEVPGFLKGSLINHVAYKVYSHMNGQEHQAKAQEYLTLYEAACVEIEESDLVNQTQSATHSKLEQRGFV